MPDPYPIPPVNSWVYRGCIPPPETRDWTSINSTSDLSFNNGFMMTESAIDTNFTARTALTKDHRPFLSDRFDVHDYAKAVLEGRQYRPDEVAEASTSASTSEKEKDVKGKGRSVDGPGKGQGQVEKGDVGVELGVELAKLNYGIVSGSRKLIKG